MRYVLQLSILLAAFGISTALASDRIRLAQALPGQVAPQGSELKPATPAKSGAKGLTTTLRVSDSGNQPFLINEEVGDAGEERADHATVTIHVAADVLSGCKQSREPTAPATTR